MYYCAKCDEYCPEDKFLPSSIKRSRKECHACFTARDKRTRRGKRRLKSNVYTNMRKRGKLDLAKALELSDIDAILHANHIVENDVDKVRRIRFPAVDADLVCFDKYRVVMC